MSSIVHFVLTCYNPTTSAVPLFNSNLLEESSRSNPYKINKLKYNELVIVVSSAGARGYARGSFHGFQPALGISRFW